MMAERKALWRAMRREYDRKEGERQARKQYDFEQEGCRSFCILGSARPRL